MLDLKREGLIEAGDALCGDVIEIVNVQYTLDGDECGWTPTGRLYTVAPWDRIVAPLCCRDDSNGGPVLVSVAPSALCRLVKKGS